MHLSICTPTHASVHTVHLSYPRHLSTLLSHLNAQLARTCRPQLHAFLCSSQSLLHSELYHQYVINSNVLLKTSQVIFEITSIMRDLRKSTYTRAEVANIEQVFINGHRCRDNETEICIMLMELLDILCKLTSNINF